MCTVAGGAKSQTHKSTKAQKHKAHTQKSHAHARTNARTNARTPSMHEPLTARTPQCAWSGRGSVSVWYGRVAGEELPRYGAVRPGVCGQQVEVPTGGVREMGCQRHQGGGGVTTRWGDGHVSHVCLVLHCTVLHCIALRCANGGAVHGERVLAIISIIIIIIIIILDGYVGFRLLITCPS